MELSSLKSIRVSVILNKILSMLVIIFLLTPTVMTTVSRAETRPDSIRVVTDEVEKEALLGTTSEKARKENILGLASKFSLFTKDNIHLTKADAEGRIASGGTITSTYAYNAGTEVENDNVAKIIAKNGFSRSIELLLTTHATTAYDVTYDHNKKKIAAVGTNATNMAWSDFSETQRKQIVASDLIDFDEEFEFLQSQSDYLNTLEPNGTIIRSGIYGIVDNASQPIRNAVVFRGTNEKLNVFSMTVDEYNELFKNYQDDKYTIEIYNVQKNNIYFDVPEESKIIINIVGRGNVEFYSTSKQHYNTLVTHDKANIFFRATKEDMANKGHTGEVYQYVHDEEDLLRDENNEVIPFKLVFSNGGDYDKVELQESPDAIKYAKRLLYNIPQATSFDIKYSMFGSILAPRASGTDDAYGYSLGTIACKSYNGGIQFGYLPFNGELNSEYNVKVSKIDALTNNNIANVEMKILDLEGKVIKTWTTDENISTVRLRPGKYILEETKVSDNYENIEKEQTVFEIIGYTPNEYILKLNVEEKEKNFVKKTYSLGGGSSAKETMRSWDKLYSVTGLEASNDIIQELEFSINTNITEDLYYIVAVNTGGIRYISYSGSHVKNTDWLEFKKWTNVKDGIISKVPVTSIIYGIQYNNYYSYRSDLGFEIHFYTGDGVEVTDQVEVTNINAVWYEPGQEETTTYGVASNVSLNEEADTLIMTNDHIKTTIELTKVNKEGLTTLLPGAVYELQDSEGTVLNTFTATDSNGKSILTDLTIDVGTYYLVEKQAPAGYKLSNEKIEVKVKPHTSETIKKEVVNEKIKVNVEKQDEFGNALEGANLQIVNSNGDIVKKWTSSNEIEVIEKLPEGEYTIQENYAPTGYVKAEDSKFSINTEGKVTVDGKEQEKIVIANNLLRGSINITKTGEVLKTTETINKQQEYEGYKFIWGAGTISDVRYELYAKNDIILNGTKVYTKDEKIGEMVTGVEGIASYEGLPRGDYYVIEKSAPNQYEIDTKVHNISLMVTYDNTNKQILVAEKELSNERKKAEVEITKTEKGTDVKLANAVYGLYNQEKMGSIEPNTMLDVVTTDEEGKGKFNIDLPVGNYYVKEIEAPQGYVISEESKAINFNESGKYEIKVEDDFSKVNIKKIDKDGNMLEGAKLKIVDKQGNEIVPEWVTTKEGKQIEKILEVGKTYTLVEQEAPQGYAVAKDKDFVVLNTQDVQIVEMIDYTTKVEISKTNAKGELLQGAKLKLVEVLEDNTEKEIESFVTGTTSYEIEGKLVVGKKYKVIETQSPKGYVTQEPLEFTVADTDKVQEIVMVDEQTKINILKQDEQGKNLEGAKLQVLDEEENIIDEWISTKDAHEINGKLEVGKTYILREIEAPVGYTIAQDKTFTVEDKKEVQEFIMNNKASKIVIEKKDEEGNFIQGAKLQLIDSNKQVIASWESGKEGYAVSNKLTLGNTYTVKEIEAPAGYGISEDISFTVENTDNLQTVTMVDKKLKIQVQKLNEEDELIEGAELQIVDLQGKVVEKFVTTKEPYTVKAKLILGNTYTLQETKPAKGYATAKEKSFMVVNEKEAQIIKMVDEKTKVLFSKYDENENLVPGAEMQVLDKEGNIIESWTTGNSSYEIIGKLEVGKTYILRETKAPEGYAIADDIEFKVEDTGKKQEIVVNEKNICIEISKLNEEGEFVEGAELQIVDNKENIIESWISGKEAYLIKNKLIANENYILKEIKPARGYVTAKPVEIKVKNTGKIQKVSMIDKKTKVSILKVDENNKELIGANLQLLDNEGNIIDEWTSVQTAKEFEGKLIVGKTYKIKEIKAPDGYITSLEKTFTVKDTEEMQKITIQDNKTKITISKQDIVTGKELIGAKLKVVDEEENVIDEWISEEKPHEINGTLAVGKTYTLIEETAPAGYIKAEKIEFKVEDTKEVQKIEMKDDYTKVKIQKVNEEGKTVKGAELQIVDKNGNVVEKWTTNGKIYEINKKLVAGEEYTLEEIKAPKGYEKAEKITFKVSEDGKEDIVKMVDKKEDNLNMPQTGQERIIYYALAVTVLTTAVLLIVNKVRKNKKTK